MHHGRKPSSDHRNRQFPVRLNQSSPCRFVTGDWAAAERRATAVPGAEGDDEDDDVYGDFEDIEAGLGQTGGSCNASPAPC